MKTFQFETLNTTETRENKMYSYVWNTCPFTNVSNRLKSKSRLGITEIIGWQKSLEQSSKMN